jgi:hypothetical protein
MNKKDNTYISNISFNDTTPKTGVTSVIKDIKISFSKRH